MTKLWVPSQGWLFQEIDLTRRKCFPFRRLAGVASNPL